VVALLALVSSHAIQPSVSGHRIVTGGRYSLSDFEARLGHQFDDRNFLEAALTHASASEAATTYERLEFLGDRVLGLLMADFLMRRHPDENEGDLARRFAALVDRNSLAEIAGQLNLGDYLRLSSGEEAAGIRRNASVLADSMEAVIGAIYRDGGLEATRPIVEHLWLVLADRNVEPPMDVKTVLQELVQSKGRALPRYREISRSGPDHQPVFSVEVTVDGIAPARGQGTSKQAAERAAAAALLDSLRSTL
jgi:ribonuclease-3